MNGKLWLSTCAAAFVLAGCGQRDDRPGTAEAPAPSPIPAPTAAAAPPPPNTNVRLAPTEGHTASGTLTLRGNAGGVSLSGTLRGLPPNGEFGFHVHEKGDCSAPDAASAGGHFNPANAQHGNPQGAAHHADDMLNVKSDAQGVAEVDATAAGVSLGSGQPDDVRGKAIVLHEKADDYASQPAGNSGARIACGVIG